MNPGVDAAMALWPWSKHAGFASDTTYVTVDADDEGLSWTCYAPRTGKIKYFSFRTNTVSTGGAVWITIEQVDAATGLQNGTLLDATCGEVSLDIATADDNTIKTVDLTNSGAQSACAVTAGDRFSVVLKRKTGGGSTLNGQISSSNVDFRNLGHGYLPNGVSIGSGWVLRASSRDQSPYITLEYEDGYVYCPHRSLCGTWGSNSFNSGDNPNKRGNRFVVPTDMWYFGAQTFIDHQLSATFAACDIKLYDQHGNVLSTLTTESERNSFTAAATQLMRVETPLRLRANTPYYLMYEPVDTTGVAVYSWTPYDRAGNGNVFDNMPGGREMYRAYGTSFPFTFGPTIRQLISPFVAHDVPVRTTRTRIAKETQA